MKKRKKIKIGVFSVLGLALLFFIVLVVHIGIMVHNRSEMPLATVQMARVDFNEPIQTMQAKNIQNKIKDYKGVKSTYFNRDNGILIYTFDNRVNTTANIYSDFEKENQYSCSLHTVSENDLSHGCPVIEDDSFYGKLTHIVSKYVN